MFEKARSDIIREMSNAGKKRVLKYMLEKNNPGDMIRHL